MDAAAPILPFAPPPPPMYQVAQNDATAWKSGGMMTNEEALEALRGHCKKLFCWGEGPINKMNIKTLQPTTAYKVYFIQTLTP